MNAKPIVPDTLQPGEITNFSVLLSRVMWTLLGPGFLAILTYRIVSDGTGWLTVLDACYGVVLLLMIGGRWRELSSGAGTTITGEAVTVAHLRRYILIVAPAAVAVWIAANAVGNHVLNG
jgi:hypothetical protein